MSVATASTKAKLRAAAKSQPRSRGRFARKHHNITPSNIDTERLNTPELQQRYTATYNIEQTLAQVGSPETLDEALEEWQVANAYASLTRQAMSKAAEDFAGMIGADATGKKFTITDTLTGQVWGGSTGAERPQYADETGREMFLEQAANAENCEEVTALSRNMWRDASWSAPRLADMGVPVYDTDANLCSVTQSGWTVQPDDDMMALYAKSLEHEVNEAVNVKDPGQRLLTASRLNGLANESKKTAAEALKDHAASAFDVDFDTHSQKVDVQDELTIRPTFSYKQWNSAGIHEHLTQQAGNDPAKLAEMINTARPRGGWSAKAGVPKIMKAPLTSIKPVVANE